MERQIITVSADSTAIWRNRTLPPITGNITTGSPLVTGISSLIDIRVGMRISGTGIPDGTVINSINTTTSTIRLSANATATTAGVTLTPRTSIYAFIRALHLQAVCDTMDAGNQV